MFGETYLEPQGVINDAFRSFLSAIDRPFYGFLAIAYQLFFNVASAEIFSGDMIVTFFSRVQLIIGVFMMFQLAMTIMKGIVNPDVVTDSKSGMGNIVVRICTSLILLALVVPINLSGGGNELEKQINNNGILFGTLYSLQNRVLSNNTIGKLVLGVSGNEQNYVVSTNGKAVDTSDLETSAKVFTASVLKAFYRINLLPKDQREEVAAGQTAEQKNANRVCQDMPQSITDEYFRLDADTDTIIGFVNKTCLVDNNPVQQLASQIDFFNLSGNKVYMFVYTPVISTIVAVILVVILLGFTIDIAIRAIKLAILRLVAPVPIIKHMNPQGSGDEALSMWGKTIASTYLDLFIRLVLVYFIVFFIQQMIIKGIVINQADGMVGIYSFVLIIIALFLFAKEAPKFIKQAMGMKDDGGNLFAGVGALLGLGVAAAGSIGSAVSSIRSSRDADKAYDEEHGTDTANRGRNRAKHAVAGIFGGAAGFLTGAHAVISAKDKQASAAYNAITNRNERVRLAGQSGGTLLGGVGSSARQFLTGESSYDSLDRSFKQQEASIKQDEANLSAEQARLKTDTANNARLKRIVDRVKSETVGSDDTVGTVQLKNGRSLTANYKELNSAYEAAKNGIGVQKFYLDQAGNSISETAYNNMSTAEQRNCTINASFNFNGEHIDMAEAANVLTAMQKANEANYYEQAISNPDFDSTFSAERAQYRSNTGSDISSSYSDVKDGSGNVTSKGIKTIREEGELDINRRSDELSSISQGISERKQQLGKQKQGYDARRAESNAKRFGRGNRS